jgi:hypothetical protein
MRSSSGGLDPEARLGCVSTGMGGGIGDSDGDGRVIELERLALAHDVCERGADVVVGRDRRDLAERAIPRVTA